MIWFADLFCRGYLPWPYVTVEMSTDAEQNGHSLCVVGQSYLRTLFFTMGETLIIS